MFSHTASGSIALSGSSHSRVLFIGPSQGLGVLSGSAELLFILSHMSQGSINLSGSSEADFNLDHSSQGLGVLSGSAELLFSLNHTPEGLIRLLSNLPSIYTFLNLVGRGISITNKYTYRQNITNSYNFDFSDNYNIYFYEPDSAPDGPDLDIINIDFSASYNIGETDKSWWRIQCCCKPAQYIEANIFSLNKESNYLIKSLGTDIKANPNEMKKIMENVFYEPYNHKRYILENKKNNLNLSAQEHNLPEPEVMCQSIYDSGARRCGSGNLTLITLCRTSTVNDVCAIIKNPEFGPQYVDVFSVLSIQKWDSNQRLWIEQEYCNYPNCASLCVDFSSTEDHAAFVMSVSENYNELQGSGKIVLTGSSYARAIAGTHLAEGQIKVTGSFYSVISSSISFNSEGKSIKLEGSSEIFVSHVNSRGGVIVYSDRLDVISSSYSLESFGNISINGSARINYSIIYEDGVFDIIFLSGKAISNIPNKKFIYIAEGSIIFNGQIEDFNSSNYRHDALGLISISNNISEVISGNRQYLSEDGVRVNGSARTSRFVVAYGEILLSGTADSNYVYTHVGSGGLSVSNRLQGITSSYFGFKSLGLGPISVRNDGVYVSYKQFLEAQDTFAATMTTGDVSLGIDNVVDDGFSDLTISSGTVNACGCRDVGISVQLFNNISNVPEIKNFINRNKLNGLDNLSLNYVTTINSWNNIQHLSGLGADNSLQNWKFVFQLSCTNKTENLIGDYYFKFLFLAQKEIPSKRIKLKSTLLVNMDTSLVCGSNQLLSSSVVFDTFEKVPFVDEVLIENFVYKDQIGIFSDSVWNRKYDYSYIRDGITNGPVVLGKFPEFNLNIPVGKPLEYYMTLPDESIPKKQQQILNSQVQNPLSTSDLQLKGQLGIERNNVALSTPPSSIAIFPSN